LPAITFDNDAGVAVTLKFPQLVSTVQAQENGLIRVFVLLVDSNRTYLAGVQRFVETSGGHITHVFPHQAVIARFPAGARQALNELPGVVLVTTGPIELSTVDAYGSSARSYAGVWNSLVDTQSLEPDLMTTAHSDEPIDALIAPDLPPASQLMATSDSIAPGYYQTSEYMAGSVAVGIVLVESDGSVDPSTEDWTADEKQLVFSEIVAALNWWAELEPRANLSFIYDDHFSNPIPVSMEPITRPYYHQQYWIDEAMTALGYSTSSYFTAVRDYDNYLRTTYQTDWAFTIFIVDSSTDGDNRFSDGFFAYAYLGGPFLVLTYGNDGYGPGNMDAVAAHETGHIFYALDQYYGAYQPCDRRSGYLDVENQNSQYGTCALSTNSIMRGQTYPYKANAIDPYAAGQIGWRDSDNDNIFDPLDTGLPIEVTSVVQNDNNITVNGTAQIIPFPSPRHTSVTINRLTGVKYRFNTGNWQQAAAVDGVFEGTVEDYFFSTTGLDPGLYTLEVAAVDSASNVSDTFAREEITILDPIDGGLNTQLDTSSLQYVGQTAIIDGIAYHATGGKIAKVEYRLDGGPWQGISAQDGAFDSGYEPFTISLDVPGGGPHLLEAFATDATGQAEVNMAHQDIQFAMLFLPLIHHAR
jgi:hypothetical protein